MRHLRRMVSLATGWSSPQCRRLLLMPSWRSSATTPPLAGGLRHAPRPPSSPPNTGRRLSRCGLLPLAARGKNSTLATQLTRWHAKPRGGGGGRLSICGLCASTFPLMLLHRMLRPRVPDWARGATPSCSACYSYRTSIWYCPPKLTGHSSAVLYPRGGSPCCIRSSE